LTNILEADNFIAIGKITKPIGLKGWMKLESYCQHKEDIFKYNYFFKQIGDSYESLTITRKYNRNKSDFIISCDNVNNIDEAEKLRNVEIYIEKNQLEPLKEGEFYYHDLLGYSVESPDYDKVGVIKSIHNFGAGDIIEVNFPLDKKTYLFPLNNDNIEEINSTEKKIKLIVLKDYL